MVSARLCGHDESAPTPDGVFAASIEIFAGFCRQNEGKEITYGCTKILNGYTFTGNRIYGNFKPLEIYGEPYARERQAVGNLRATVRKI